jgi:hypothetical protein
MPSRGLGDLCYSTFNLRQATESICNHLVTATHQPSNSDELCLGFLESEDRCRLVFFGMKALRDESGSSSRKALFPFIELLGNLQRIHQLKMAMRISEAVLKFFATPWLPDDWRLQDLGFFGRPLQGLREEALEDLDTLHISAQIPAAVNVSQEDLEENISDSALSIAQRYSIRNLTLANLGIALLEIGLGKDIRYFRRSHEPHDVLTARKLAEGLQTPLGPQYQAIIRKLVYCDFALGGDLTTKELQDAVYSDVVCSLGGLIRSCESLG